MIGNKISINQGKSSGKNPMPGKCTRAINLPVLCAPETAMTQDSDLELKLIERRKEGQQDHNPSQQSGKV
jgi:hypothetical protein